MSSTLFLWNEVEDNKAPLEPPYGKNRTDFVTNPTLHRITRRPPFWVHPRRFESRASTRCLFPMAWAHGSEHMEAAQASVDGRWTHRVCSPHSVECLSALKGKGIPTPRYSMGGPRGRCAEWMSQTQTDRYGPTHWQEVPGGVGTIETERGTVGARAGGGAGSECFVGTERQFGKTESSGDDRGDGCAAG